MASLLAAFLVSNGAADTRYIGAQPKSAKDAKSDSGPSAAPDHIDRFGRRLRHRRRRPSLMLPSRARRQSPKPTDFRPRAGVTPSGWRGRQSRLTPPNRLRMVKLRPRPGSRPGPMAANRLARRG